MNLLDSVQISRVIDLGETYCSSNEVALGARGSRVPRGTRVKGCRGGEKGGGGASSEPKPKYQSPCLHGVRNNMPIAQFRTGCQFLKQNLYSRLKTTIWEIGVGELPKILDRSSIKRTPRAVK